MPSQYPASIDNTTTLPLLTDSVSAISAANINVLRNVIVAIETELGVKPSGIYSTVKARLDAIDTAIQNISGGGGGFTLGGDLGGTPTSQIVIGLQGRAISALAPQAGQALIYNGVWTPGTNFLAQTIRTTGDGYFATVHANAITTTGDGYVNGNFSVAGNLTVYGTTTTIDSTIVDIEGRIIHVNYSPINNVPVPSLITGIEAERGDTAGVRRDAAAILWDETNQRWDFAFQTQANNSGIGSDLAIKALGATLSGLGGNGAGIVGVSNTGLISFESFLSASSSINQLFNIVTLERFGAVGDGVTNDSAAMTAALAAVTGGGTIQLASNKTYLISGSAPYSVPANVSIIGYGDSSIIKTTTDNAVFIPAGDHTSFLNFKIVGSGAGATSQIGIANQNLGAGAGSGFHWMRIDGMTFDSLGAAGILTYQIPAPIATVTPYFTVLISNTRAWQCGRGLWLLGEYSTVTGIQIDGCGVGIECEGGNQVYVGGTITACTTGFKLDGGGNDAHGVVSGMEFNHNTTNIFVWNNELNGEKFVDCMIYSGDILLQSTLGVQFIGCQIDINNYYFDGSIGTVFDNCTFPQSAGTNIIHNSYNGHISKTRWNSNNVDLDGYYPGFIIAGNDGYQWQHYFDGYVVASNMAGFGDGYAAVDITGKLHFTSTIGTGGISHGTVGQIFVTDATPASNWTSLINYETTHGRFSAGAGGSDFKAVIGPTVTTETTGASLYLLGNVTAPSSSNYSIVSDGTNLVLNSPLSTGTVFVENGTASVVAAFDGTAKRWFAGGNTATAPLLIDWATTNQTQLMSGTSQTSLLIANTNSGAASIIFQSGTSGIAWRDAGQVQRGSIDITHGIAKFGGAGSDWYGAIGPDDTSPTLESGVWLLPPGTARTGSNMSLLNNGSATYLNTQANFLSFTSNSFGVNLAWMQGNLSQFYLWNMPNFTWNVGGGAPLLSHEPRTTDVAAGDFTVRAQYALAAATTNTRSGSIIFDFGPPSTGFSTEALVKITRNGVFEWAAGAAPSTPLSQAMMWLGPGITPTGNNPVLVSDGASFTYMNTPTGGAVGWLINDSTFIAYAQATHIYYGGTSVAGSLISFDWATSTAPTISFNEGSTGTLLINPRTSNAAHHDLIIKGQYGFSPSTGANRKPGNVIIDVGFPTDGYSGTDSEAALWFTRNGSTLAKLQPYTNGPTTTFAIYPGTFTPNSTNYAWLMSTDGSSQIFGAAAGGNIQWRVGGSVYLSADDTSISTVLGKQASENINTLNGALEETTRSKSTNFTIDTSTADRHIFITATLTMTLSATTINQGHRTTIWIDTTSTGSNGSDITLTIAPAATEKINGTNANWVMTVPGSPKQMVQLDMIGDGTNVRVVGG